jgi:hypothetical protein
VNHARRDLCGGCSAMGIPTAITRLVRSILYRKPALDFAASGFFQLVLCSESVPLQFAILRLRFGLANSNQMRNQTEIEIINGGTPARTVSGEAPC